jgi:protein gp37
MGSSSEIEWTDATWNPVAGCKVLSAGCTNCYAMRMAARLEAMGQEKYSGLTRKSGGRFVWTGKVRLDEGSLWLPYKWSKGRRVFVNSMSDLFHDKVPIEFIQAIFKVMIETPHHTYQVLTKRADRMLELSDRLDWPPNAWMGVSVESEEVVWRIDRLRRTGAHVKFLSCEPLIGPIRKLDLRGIDWVIAGGESGPRARPMEADWVRSIRDKCVRMSVPFHFKQWGGPVKSKTGRILDGRTWDQTPQLVSKSIKSTAIAAE